MATLTKSRFFDSPALDSRIKSQNVTGSERWIGYFLAPLLVYCAYTTLAGTYLNQFYVDVLKLGTVGGGAFLVLLPILSKIFDAITNLAMGVIIDRTKTRQGKARPWILISAPLVMITGIMLYWIPKASANVQAIWVAISYNLYFAFSFTIYNMSQALMVPLSTRNTRQRDNLALFLSMGQSMIPGSIIYIVFPMLVLPWLGVQGERWVLVMSILSIAVLPGTILQYYFTKERISEDAAASDAQRVPLMMQIKTCLSDRYWIIYMLIWIAFQFSQCLYGAASNFFGNWVLGTYNDGTTIMLMNAVGQGPLGLGVFLLWPIAKKFGKRRTLFVGMLMATVGSLLVYLNPTNMGAVLGALAFKSFGMLPTYLFAAMMAEAMDHIEWKTGYRCDGFTATVSSVIITVMAGASTSVFNAGLNTNGYVPPASDGSWLPQNAATQNWIAMAFALIPAIVYLIIAVLAFFYKVEYLVPQMSADISARHRAEAEAKGEVYYSPEEKAAMEQAENDRIAEENRIAELKLKCEKKGLSFEEEEARYQAKLAEQKAKAEAKAAKKDKKK